jgi:hypothetical protein
MPIVSLEDAQRNITLFKQDYIELANNSELTPQKRKESRNACNKKILRWQGYVQSMLDNGEEISFFGYRISPEQARVNASNAGRTRNAGRPRIYTPEEMKERIREQKRNYSRKYYATRRKNA